MRADRAPVAVDSACQLELFDQAPAELQRVEAAPLVLSDRRENAHPETLPTEPASPSEATGGGMHAGADRVVLKALEVALADARAAADMRPPLVVLASCLGGLGAPPAPPPAGGVSLRQARDDWLRRLETSQKSESALVAYRVAIDDLLDWLEANGRSVLEEAAIVDYLSGYQQRAHPAPATYYRRFLLVRRFVRWVSRRDGVCDPFLDLEPPPKPRQERDWLTREEFRRLLDAAGRPERNLPGLIERDRLALLALVTTGLRRSELCALEWRDLELDGRKRSLLVRCGKGGKARRQPVPAGLARELRKLRDSRQPEPADPVFCGLAGGRLQQTTLADIIRRASTRAGISKHVTAHTLAPHRCDLAAAGARRHPPRRRVPRPRRSLDRRALCARRPRRALRRGRTARATGRSGGACRAGRANDLQPTETLHRASRLSRVVAAVAGGDVEAENADGGRLIGRARRSRGRRTALRDPNSGAVERKRRNRPLKRWRRPSACVARERGAALSASQASRSCSLAWACARGDHDRALEHLGVEEGLHQLVVGAVAEHLRLDADGGGVLGRVGRPLAGQPVLEDPLGGPPVDGVGGDLDLEHPVGHVLAHARAGEAGAGGRRARAP